MRQVETSKRFRRDYQKLLMSGKSMKRIDYCMNFLIDGKQLSPDFRDHSLSGKLKGFRDCHITPDWILLYQIKKTNEGETIVFHATGNHSSLFK